MSQADTWFEVVYVLRDFQLLDAESYQRTYIRRDGKPLAKGYYIVSWPPGSDTDHFGIEAHFHGPFMRRLDAVTNMYRLQGLLRAHDYTTLHMTCLASELNEVQKVGRGKHEQSLSDE